MKFQFCPVNQDNYPAMPAVWFTENEEADVVQLVSSLESISGDSTVTNQVKTLLTGLCSIHSCPLPEEAKQLVSPEYPPEPSDESDTDEDDSMCDTGEFMMDDEAAEVEPAKDETDGKSDSADENSLDADHKELLRKVAEKQIAKGLMVSEALYVPLPLTSFLPFRKQPLEVSSRRTG